MALNFSTNPTFTGRITAPDANYPQGSSKDETSPGANDGMPYIKQRADDILGMQQALLLESGITPSGSADTAIASQYLDAMKLILKSGRKNFFINGDMRIAQRGTSFPTPTSTDYTLDRWSILFVTGADQPDAVSQVGLASPDNATLPFDKFLRIDMPAGVTGSAEIVQKIEDINRFRSNKTYTLSFFAKADIAETIQIIQTQDYGVGGSADDITVAATAAVTTSWQKFEKPITLSDYSGKTIGTDSVFSLAFRTDISNQVLELSNIQLEEGTIATDFEDRSPAGELALCQRYFQNRLSILHQATASIAGRETIALPVQLRAAPTITFTAGSGSGHTVTDLNQGTGLLLDGVASGAGRLDVSAVSTDAEL